MPRRFAWSNALPGAAAYALAAFVSLAPAHAAKAPPRPLDPVQQANLVNNADDAFVAARDAYRNNDPVRGAVFADRTMALDSRYPLASYLQYWALRRPTRRLRQRARRSRARRRRSAGSSRATRTASSPISPVATGCSRSASAANGRHSKRSGRISRSTTTRRSTCFHLTARALRQIRDGATAGRRAVCRRPW